MFDFLRKNKDNEDIKQLNENLNNIVVALSEISNNTFTMKNDLQLILGYLAQIRFAEQELVKNTAFANALDFLEAQYNSSDSIMNIEEVKKYYTSIRNEIFIEYNEDYKARSEKEQDNENENS
jgi:hypothetical protein